MKIKNLKIFLFVFVVLGVLFIFGPKQILAQQCCKILQPDGTFKCFSTNPQTGCMAGVPEALPCEQVVGCPQNPLTTTTPPSAQAPKQPEFVPPKLQVPLLQRFFPGFTTEKEKIIVEEGGTEYYRFPWIGEYFAGLFRWGTWAISIIAVIMIMVAGVQWMLAMGNQSKISQAKNRIGDALFGLILILSANLLLGFINPNLTVFKPIVIEKIKKIKLNDWTEEVSLVDTSCPSEQDLQDISNIDNIVFVSQYSQPFLLPATAEKLKEAAIKLKEKGVVLQVNNAFRTREQQQYLYDTRGKNPGCAPKPNECNCPHMIGRGVDVVCKGKSANDPCQKLVEEAMRAVGFCQLKGEAWHFEYPKTSSTCY
jgi:D-alanyl-D-alanine dipeptidase